jgi:cyclase
LLWKTFGLVKGVAFDSWRRVGPVLPAVKVYNQREVDELILLDICASTRLTGLDFESIEDFGRECCVPLTVGGGVCRIEQVQRLLRIGADKICINSAAYTQPELVTEVAKLHGVQCAVVSIDTRERDGRWWCFSHAGNIETGREAISWAQELEGLGAGELVVTSIERDGTMQGYDLRLIESIVRAVKIPVIASGGAGCYEHMVDAIVKSGASAVAAASMFHFTENTPAGAKAALAKAGVPVRHPYDS